jgi:hypothetical protein
VLKKHRLFCCPVSRQEYARPDRSAKRSLRRKSFVYAKRMVFTSPRPWISTVCSHRRHTRGSAAHLTHDAMTRKRNSRGFTLWMRHIADFILTSLWGSTFGSQRQKTGASQSGCVSPLGLRENLDTRSWNESRNGSPRCNWSLG